MRRLDKVFRFQPILAGANFADRLVACVGAILSVALTGTLCSLAFGRDPRLPLLIAPVGASAVLLFAVPASPLAQPWSIIGGNILSAMIGTAVGLSVQSPVLASGLAVALAIGAMSLARCLHPPGGAAALTAVLAGPSVAAANYLFPVVPIAANSVVLVVLGWIFHRFSSHSYPHVAPSADRTSRTTPAPLRAGFVLEDIDAALEDLGEVFDIDRNDLCQLLRRVELRAMSRKRADPNCGDIMSTEVISVRPYEERQPARRLLLQHGIRTLPVTDDSGRLLGTVGLRELAAGAATVGDVMTSPSVAGPDTDVINIADVLTDGSTHAVVIVDAAEKVLGMVTQTDLLTALSGPPVISSKQKQSVLCSD